MEDECSEPLSKRINNLHINSINLGGLVSPEASGAAAVQVSGSEPSVSSSNSTQEWEEYRPSMGETNNPYYYQSNKLLYELYVQRVNRGLQRHF